MRVSSNFSRTSFDGITGGSACLAWPGEMVQVQIADSLRNGLKYGQHLEEFAVASWARRLRLAGDEYLDARPRRPCREVLR